VPRPTGPRVAQDRWIRLATLLAGSRQAQTVRRVLDRFAIADGGLLAAGVAYNAVLALIPLALLVSGLAGIVLTDPRSRADLIAAITAFLPPLAGVVDEIVNGLSRASPSVSVVGLVLAGWGTSRLFAALESAIVQLEAPTLRRGLVRRTARRLGSVVVVGGILILALIAAPALSIATELADGAGLDGSVLDMLLALLPPVLAGIALAVIYRLIPVVRPTWTAVVVPSVAGAVVLVLLTRAFVYLTPRVFGTNVVYGTLGAILVGLAWLDLVFTVILLGAAWVDERGERPEPGPA
jgi:membrane protein